MEIDEPYSELRFQIFTSNIEKHMYVHGEVFVGFFVLGRLVFSVSSLGLMRVRLG